MLKLKLICLFIFCTLTSNSFCLNTHLDKNGKAKLKKIHSKLKIIHGSLNEEYSEQIMVANFLKKNAVVLELGGNIGRNSCVIAKLLSDSKNLVTLESDPEIAVKLLQNRNLNRLNFHIEASALSKRPLIQKDWDTIPSEEVLPGYKKVNTISYSDLKIKYQKNFDTLVADCEGALFYILQDDPSMLEDVNLIFVENDYFKIPEGYQYVINKFMEYGFNLIYEKPTNDVPFFYQVWSKN